MMMRVLYVVERGAVYNESDSIRDPGRAFRVAASDSAGETSNQCHHHFD